ncbi:hypothetical protein V8E36_006026 [Tilletia maclaganii]
MAAGLGRLIKDAEGNMVPVEAEFLEKLWASLDQVSDQMESIQGQYDGMKRASRLAIRGYNAKSQNLEKEVEKDVSLLLVRLGRRRREEGEGEVPVLRVRGRERVVGLGLVGILPSFGRSRVLYRVRRSCSSSINSSSSTNRQQPKRQRLRASLSAASRSICKIWSASTTSRHIGLQEHGFLGQVLFS